MVKDITNKVKQSERRKVLNVILGAAIVFLLAIGIFSLWENYQSNQANDHGLKPSDMYETTWEMSYSPLESGVRSFMSISKDNVVLFDTVDPQLLSSSLNLDDLTDVVKDEPEGKVWEGSKPVNTGMTSLLTSYDNLEVEVIDETYHLKGQGFSLELHRISDTVVRTYDGTEYRKIDLKSSHETLRSIAEEFEE